MTYLNSRKITVFEFSPKLFNPVANFLPKYPVIEEISVQEKSIHVLIMGITELKKNCCINLKM